MTVTAGLDVARFGKDQSAITVVEDTKVLVLEEWSNRDLMETSGKALRILEEFPGAILAIDDTGVGGGVTDRLLEIIEEDSLEFTILPVNYGQVAYENKRFNNKASEMWWRVREIHDPDSENPIEYPSHHPLIRTLMAQLSGAKYKMDSRGRIWLVKADVGMESPGLADALALAYEAWVTFWASTVQTGRRITGPTFEHLRGIN